jgi:hypothetical protein
VTRLSPDSFDTGRTGFLSTRSDVESCVKPGGRWPALLRWRTGHFSVVSVHHGTVSFAIGDVGSKRLDGCLSISRLVEHRTSRSGVPCGGCFDHRLRVRVDSYSCLMVQARLVTAVKTLKDLQRRRQEMADEVAAVPLLERWGRIDQVASRHYVTSETVLAACRELHVAIPARRLNGTTLHIISLLKRNQVDADIAQHLHLSESRVREARRLGIKYGLLNQQTPPIS